MAKRRCLKRAKRPARKGLKRRCLKWSKKPAGAKRGARSSVRLRVKASKKPARVTASKKASSARRTRHPSWFVPAVESEKAVRSAKYKGWRDFVIYLKPGQSKGAYVGGKGTTFRAHNKAEACAKATSFGKEMGWKYDCSTVKEVPLTWFND